MENRSGAVLSNIQALRGLAAILVIFTHLHSILGGIGLQTFGGGGVDLFFVISGYIMTYTTCGKDVPSTVFIRNRIIRIVPIYWMMTLAVFVLAEVAPHILQNTEAKPVHLVKSLFFIPFYKSIGHLQPVLFVGWTLNYEMFFYSIFALGLLFKKAQHRILFTIGILAALCLMRIGAPFENVFLQFYSSPLLLEFAFGMLIGAAFGKNLSLSAWYWKYVLIAVFLVGVASLIFLPLDNPASWQQLLTRGIPAASVIWAASGLEQRGEAVRVATLVGVGDASYSMYLTHPFVTQIFEKICVRLQAQGVAAVFLLVGCVAAVLLTAQIGHRVVELPVINMIRRWWSDRGGRAARQVAFRRSV